VPGVEAFLPDCGPQELGTLVYSHIYRGVPGGVNSPFAGSWWSGHPPINLQIATEVAAFVDNV
jgi:hypothetical protein